MHIHPVYGISAPERGWVPAPRYLLRRDRVLRLLAGLPAGRLLEIGCGSGALLYDMARSGFHVSGLEQSAEARDLALYINRETRGLQIFETPEKDWGSAFDHVLSFEVLEHIEDDAAALQQWHSWLKPGGHLLLSVPAHRSRWSASDEWAGHCRRYERQGLLDLLRDCGFSPQVVQCYGFPLSNLIDPFRAIYHGRRLRRSVMRDRADCSLRSGIERSLETKLYPLEASLPGTLCMQFFFALQKLFLNTSLGTGFIALCTRQ
ncbi:MAG: class I SAM-dependent methyltransferase [Deltaproteobacteria bacterium]|nr:class I SAM-dependent methyltransferase [Deltaproteobacteria bacterium]